MSRIDVVVLGSANIDTSLSVDALPKPGQTIIASQLRRSIGGKGLNQAVAAARAGVPTALIAALGDDADGATIRRALRSEGILAQAVRTVAEPTGNALIIVDDDGENTIVVAPQANHSLLDVTADDKALLDGCAVLLCQLEVPVSTVLAGLQRTHASGGRTVLNAAPAIALPAEMAGCLDVLVVNEGEARVVAAGISGSPNGVVDVERLLTVAPEVIVTRGADGADYADRHGLRRRVAAPQVQAVDSTGAGDAFCGTLCAALARRAETVDALELAVNAGAWAVQHAGAIESIPRAADLTAGSAKAG
jgi:ribokinase